MVQALVVRLIACAAFLLGPSGAGAHDGHRQSVDAAGGPSSGYAFPLAAAGTYRLPIIKQAAGGRVLDELGEEHELSELMQDRISVLAFIYTRCGDVCPTASLRLAQLQDLAAGNPEVATRLKLISMSFDPEHDTPEVMAEYARNWRSADANAPEWHYVTAGSQASASPILTAYGQAVMPKARPDAAGPLYHILRVFLIDPSGRIRNIYSLDFLDPELVMADIRTLIMDLEAKDRNTLQAK